MSMKLIGIFITLCALAGAGGYYYFFVVEPQRYVAAVLELKQALDVDAYAHVLAQGIRAFLP